MRTLAKAVDAYGATIQSSLDNVVAQFRERPQRLDECMHALGMEIPRATLWREISRVARSATDILGASK